jgi:very-short-patch-repair endonuclease
MGRIGQNVLVGVLKSRRDLYIVLKKHWYRVPAACLPGRKFEYVAFYQPASFGRSGKRIEYYARVSSKVRVKRIDLLPKESSHPRAREEYYKIGLAGIRKLPRAVKNVIPRRVSFGYTTLKTLLSARNILELYGVPPTEQIVERGLNRAGIKAVREFRVSKDGRKYRIDLAVFSENAKIAIECDNIKAHGSKAQIKKDKAKDSFLRRQGWKVIRLKERDIMEKLDKCIMKIKKASRRTGVK